MIKVLVLTDFSSGYSRDLLRGIVRYAQEAGGWTFHRIPLYYRVMHGEKGIMEWARKWNADAIIAQLSDIDISSLQDTLHIPIIVQNYRERIPGICNLTGDYIGTGRLAAEFFIRKGYTHFAYYGTHDTIWSRERGMGFEKRLKENGFDLLTFFEPSYSRTQWIYNPEVLGAWLTSLPKPVAVFTCDDYFALQISETCRMYDLAVPNDVAILGVDNDELLCNISNPPLSSIVIDAENGGYVAAKVLHDLINKKIKTPFDIMVSPVQVLTRQSTQAYVIEDKYIMKIVDYIETHYADHITVSDLQELVPLSRRVFEKRFRSNTGMSIYQFLQKTRIERFAGELITSNKSIESIAASCGFEDYKNVSRIFARYKGISPSQYRKKYYHTLNYPNSEKI